MSLASYQAAPPRDPKVANMMPHLHAHASGNSELPHFLYLTLTREHSSQRTLLMTSVAVFGNLAGVKMIAYVWIALGGALGSVARFALNGVVSARVGETFPWGTIVVNVIGSFLIGDR